MYAIPTKYYKNDDTKENETNRTSSTHRRDQKCKRLWCKNMSGTENFEDLVRWKDSGNIKMDLIKQTGFKDEEREVKK